MAKILLISLVSILFGKSLNAQNLECSEQLQTINNTITGINSANYKLIKKQWGLLGKILVPKKKMKKEFHPLVEKHGVFNIDTVVFSSKYMATAELHSPSSDKRTFLQFIFNEKSKLQGLGYGYPTFVYKKSLSNGVRESKEYLVKQIDSMVVSRIEKKAPYNFNGSILISEGESILYKKSAGSLNFSDDQSVNDSSKFLLASCSKQFTAVAIMKLAEEGLLNFDDPVNKHLSEFPYPEITIRHLLTHTSGLSGYFALLKKHWDPTKFVTNQDVLDLYIEHQPKLQFTPNDRFTYSNTGYIMLSLIIESVSKQSYGDYLKAIIFDPLEMRNTSVYHRRISGNTLENYAVGNVYSRSQKKYILPDSSANHKYVSYMDGLTGDDGVSSSILDLKKWNEGLNSWQIVGSEMLELGRKRHVLDDGSETNYGFGIMVKDGNEIQNIEYHTGGWPGYSIMIIRLTELDRNIIFLSNNEYDYFETLLDEIVYLLCK